jgi:hypothetical protein
MSINLSDFTPLTATFELRYAPRHLIWDRSGTLWTRIASTYPAIATKQAVPNQVTVRLEPGLEAAIGVESAQIAFNKPDTAFTKLKSAASAIVPAMIELFEIEQFTRVGLRLVYAKRFSDRDSAADYFTTHVPMPCAPGPVMNISGRLFDPQISFRRESDTGGFLLRLHVNQQKLNFELPVEYQHLMPPPEELTINQVIVDIDYYLHSLVSVDQVRAEELIEQWLRLIKRDIGKVLS